MKIFRYKAPDPGPGRSSNADWDECQSNGWCFGCGGVGRLGNTFGGVMSNPVCPECRGSGRAKR